VARCNTRNTTRAGDDCAALVRASSLVGRKIDLVESDPMPERIFIIEFLIAGALEANAGCAVPFRTSCLRRAPA
jgi:hypothetical protein